MRSYCLFDRIYGLRCHPSILFPLYPSKLGFRWRRLQWCLPSAGSLKHISWVISPYRSPAFYHLKKLLLLTIRLGSVIMDWFYIRLRLSYSNIRTKKFQTLRDWNFGKMGDWVLYRTYTYISPLGVLFVNLFYLTQNGCSSEVSELDQIFRKDNDVSDLVTV